MFILAAFAACAASIMRAQQARLVLKKPEGVMDGRGINDPLYCSDAVPGGVGDRRSAFALLWQAAERGRWCANAHRYYRCTPVVTMR